jgi:hypothetical protein
MFAARPDLWQDSVRKVALIAFIASILAMLGPAWNLIRSVGRLDEGGTAWLLFPIALLAFLPRAILPVFFIALYRDHGALRIPKTLRLLSLAGAVIGLLFVVAAIRVESLDPDFGARGGGVLDNGARTVSHTISLATAFSEAALFALLLMFFLQPPLIGPPSEVPLSRFLDQSTKIAVVCFKVVIAFCLLRVFLTLVMYSTLGDAASRFAATMLSPSLLLLGAIRTLVTQACVFIAPFVVLKSCRPSAQSRV